MPDLDVVSDAAGRRALGWPSQIMEPVSRIKDVAAQLKESV